MRNKYGLISMKFDTFLSKICDAEYMGIIDEEEGTLLINLFKNQISNRDSFDYINKFLQKFEEKTEKGF